MTQITLFDSAFPNVRIQRHGNLSHVRHAAGQLLARSADLVHVQRWAEVRLGSGDPDRDRQGLIRRLGLAVVCNDAFGCTTGEAADLRALANEMLREGVDLEPWDLPEELKDPDLMPMMAY